MEIRKKQKFYAGVLLLWSIVACLAAVPFVNEVERSIDTGQNFILSILLIFNAVFILYFWLNATKDIVYTFYFWLNRKKFDSEIKTIDTIQVAGTDRVVLLYTTCDDFIEDSLLQSIQQDYDNFYTVILDDSRTEEYKNMVDRFVSEYNGVYCDIFVVRRNSSKGFKAGNLNNYLVGNKEYDYFVILDSDEIIPNNFIKQSLKYFAYYSNAGIVQGNHISTRNLNKFMSELSIGVDSHWDTYQSVKHKHGFMSFLGHGAMISRECFEATGKFPEIVAEDLCFSIEARFKGYLCVFAKNIYCQEQYPVNYSAFKKRHSKWTQGNMEFIRKYTSKIVKGKMSWFEKLDIFLFTYNLPLTVFFTFYMAMNVVIFPALGYSLKYPFWMLIPTVISLAAPIINDIIYHTKPLRLRIIPYIVNIFVLYGSLYFISMYASFKALVKGEAKFIVTPKVSQKTNLTQSIRDNYREIIFAVFLMIVSFFMTNSILPVLLIAIPSCLSVYVGMMSNKLSPDRDAKRQRNFTTILITDFIDEKGYLCLKSIVNMLKSDGVNFEVLPASESKKLDYKEGDYVLLTDPSICNGNIQDEFYNISNLKQDNTGRVTLYMPKFRDDSVELQKTFRKSSKNYVSWLKLRNINNIELRSLNP